MQHIQYLLLPGEKVLFNGRIHPILYLGGLAFIVSSLSLVYFSAELTRAFPTAVYYAGRISAHLPYPQYHLRIVAGLLFGIGVIKLLNAYMIIYSTELVITDRRVICKVGITTTVTFEMDRGKIAGVIVRQSIPGRILNYGWVTLRGFAGDIAGLPALWNPNGLQQHINSLRGAAW